MLRMAADGIDVPYNRELRGLEDLLATVRRPGDFCVEASFETPMPRLEVDGVGGLSFPVPETQTQQLIARASRAPYGRGEETILDESVRRVWQLPPASVRLGGKSWGKTFAQIMAKVADGLGCADTPISAELYKLLVYDEGGFFAPHRDTEKAPHMFGTLIVVLPSAHRGGDLVIRHGGRETTFDLSDGEGSELRVAAFYADCEHEVLPVTSGHRICLVYNLLQAPAKGRAKLTAPPAGNEAQAAAAMLREAFAGGNAPPKLAWLFQHAYSPAGLSFAALKGEDAALAKVLRRAAEAASCAVHLGIVHIEEYGAAEEKYDPSGGYWGHHEEDDEDNDDGKGSNADDDFEVIDVCDRSRYVAEWRDPADRPVAFGKLPLEDGEVLPAGALDGEKPDQQRLTEATGNEGASFERSYHRAALVLWPRDRFADVLLQAGVAAVLPHLAEQVDAAGTTAQRTAVIALARRVIKAWETPADAGDFSPTGKAPDRSTMLGLLVRLGDPALLERFIEGVVAVQFDGSETAALAAAATHLPPPAIAPLFAKLALEKTLKFPVETIRLLAAVIKRLAGSRDLPWDKALLEMAAAIVAELPALTPPPPPRPTTYAFWDRASAAESMARAQAELAELNSGANARGSGALNARLVIDLFAALRLLDAGALRTKATTAIAGNPAVFDPVEVVAPALAATFTSAGSLDADEARLWTHAAEFLLTRSEHPPAPPVDWKQPVEFPCKSEDERQLQAFAGDPAARVYRFRVKKERRQELHRLIERLGLDMTHVTDRQGSPQTLVCTKTLRTFERECAQHQANLGAMSALLNSPPPTSAESARLLSRLAAATKRFPAKPAL